MTAVYIDVVPDYRLGVFLHPAIPSFPSHFFHANDLHMQSTIAHLEETNVVSIVLCAYAYITHEG